MTPEEAKQRIVPKLVAARSGEVTWADVVSAINAANPAQQNRIARAISRNRYEVVGKVIAKLINQAIRDEAQTRADAILADNSVDLTELGELL